MQYGVRRDVYMQLLSCVFYWRKLCHVFIVCPPGHLHVCIVNNVSHSSLWCACIHTDHRRSHGWEVGGEVALLSPPPFSSSIPSPLLMLFALPLLHPFPSPLLFPSALLNSARRSGEALWPFYSAQRKVTAKVGGDHIGARPWTPWFPKLEGTRPTGPIGWLSL